MALLNAVVRYVVGQRRDRTSAAERWSALSVVARWPLAAVLVVLGLFALAALVGNQDRYLHPWVANATYGAACAAAGLLWWRGPRGIGPWLAAVSAVSVVVCALVLGAQLPAGEVNVAYWIGGWSVAVIAVLGFARPPDEVVLVTAALVAANGVFVAAHPAATVAVRHIAPITVGTTGVMGLAILGFTVALRSSLGAARRARAEAERVEVGRAAAAEVLAQRARRSAHWEGRAVPLLMAIASGDRSVEAVDVVAEARELATRMRSELAGSAYISPFEVLLGPGVDDARARGVRVDIYDAEVGRLLPSSCRAGMVALLADLLAATERGSLRLTLLPGEVPEVAVVIVAVDGAPVPASALWTAVAPDALVTIEGPERWWWEATLRTPARG